MSVTVLHFFQKSIFWKLRVQKARILSSGRHARDLKMAITFIPLVPQKTVKYKSCSYWWPETFITVWQGLKIDILEVIWCENDFLTFFDPAAKKRVHTPEIFENWSEKFFFGPKEEFWRGLGGLFGNFQKSSSTAYLYKEAD